MRLGRRGHGDEGAPLSKRALLQHVNRELSLLAAGDAALPIYCECGSEDCIMSLDVTRDEFAAARAHPTGVIVLPEHKGRLEPVLERFESFLVVAGTEAAGASGTASDADRMPDGLEL